MLGFRLNKLGAAMRSGLDLRSLYGGGYYGFLPKLESSDYVRQTYNAPTTTAASAGDPIGLWLPSQSPTDVTNLLLWTDAFDNAVWAKTALTVTANVAVGPSGSPTADLLVPSTGNTSHTTAQAATVTNGAQYTWSVCAKPAGYNFIVVQILDNGGAFAYYNVSTGVITSSGNSPDAVTITADSNGYYRCTLTKTMSSTTCTCVVYVASADGGAVFAGNGTSGVYVSKAQLNLGSTALNYQPNADCLGGSNRRTGGSNMLLWSQEFDHPTWTLSAATVTGGATTAPDGTLTADKLIESATTAQHFVRQNATGLVGTSYAGSVYVKAAERTAAVVIQYDGSTFGGASINLSTGVLSAPPADLSLTDLSASMISTSANNGFWRVSAARTQTATTTIQLRISTQSGSNGVYAGNGTSGIYVWGAMVNIGSSADTYSRNMDQLGGLLQAVVPFQATSANRGTRARRPLSGIRNRAASNAMAGVVAGTPGTPSTDWTYLVIAGGLTRTIVGSGTENGIPYSEIRVFGTTSNANGVNIGVATAAAVTGETWTNSIYHRLIAGSLTGITNFQIGVIENTSGGVFVAGAFYSITAPTSAALDTQRYSATRTFSGGATVGQNAQTYLINIPTATTVDFTIRIGGVQPEKAAAASAFQLVTSASNITESGQPDVWHTYYDGTSDYADTGVQSFGTASLFAAAGQAWTVWFVCRTLSTGTQGIITKCGSTPANWTLNCRTNAGVLQIYLRGTANFPGYSWADGVYHVGCLRWDGTTAKLWADNSAAVTLSVGSAVEEAENILVAARTTAAPAVYFTGHNDVAMIDRALTDAEVTNLMAYLNATYRAGL